jgi:hypothetical protein
LAEEVAGAYPLIIFFVVWITILVIVRFRSCYIRHSLAMHNFWLAITIIIVF